MKKGGQIVKKLKSIVEDEGYDIVFYEKFSDSEKKVKCVISKNLIEISFYRNKSLHIEGVTDDDETKELLEQCVYNFVDDVAEDKNQQIIETIRKKG